MTTKLLKAYKQKIKSFELIPSDGGCFELTINGKLAYSKLDTGAFPNESDMVSLVGKRLGA